MSELRYDWDRPAPTHPLTPSRKREAEIANPVRGEATLRIGGETLVLRPSFAALVAVEQEVGSLFALVERAAAGGLAIDELVALFWHCLSERPEGLSREAFAEGVTAGGLVAAAPALKVLLGQILAGR